MTIDALPTPPNSSNPASFASDMDAFLAALPTFRMQANALGSGSAADAATATTQAGIATTQAGLATSNGAAQVSLAAAQVALAAADVVLTHADVVITHADASATAADRVQSGLDRVAAAASAASAAAIAGAFVGTSTTNWTPAVGTKAFVTQTGEQYTAGTFLSVVSSSTPSAWGVGQCVSYIGSTLTMDIQVIAGSGAHTDWNISLTGTRGATGPAGAGVTPQSVGFTLAGGTTSKTFTGDVDLQASLVAQVAASQAEMEAGTVTMMRTMTPERVKQAITALSPPSPEIITPTNVSPASGATGQVETPTLTGSAFYSNYGATQSAIQVQVSTSSSFASPLYTSGDQAAGISFTLPAATLSVSTTYYWRVRYKNSKGTYSDWSAATTFVTASAFNSFIATPTATPGSFGSALEGGFYAGLIWNELIESSTSVAIATGSKTFTVSSGVAYCYSGQTLEVRSRANPANKMIGTVTAANLSSVTINVTSIGGSGTFTDWSVMAQYRVIVAPKASGENASIMFKNANSAAPSACGTLTEGKKATDAMVAADTSTVYPAAWWCHNLSIGGKTDWYLPARDELELAWRNLKPTADANYTSADRSTGATPNYANLGSYGDTANTHGLNNNSSPAGAAYSSGTPAQVAAGKNFRAGESEAFAYGSYTYWSASEYSTTGAWYQYWYSGYSGYQNDDSKTFAACVRAVRRSII